MNILEMADRIVSFFKDEPIVGGYLNSFLFNYYWFFIRQIWIIRKVILYFIFSIYFFIIYFLVKDQILLKIFTLILIFFYFLLFKKRLKLHNKLINLSFLQ